ncbi:hypothetical protein [Streptomyces eurythermus]
MDLEGIGAIAAAAVGAIGVLAAVVVGRWNLRAMLRAADRTYQGALGAAVATASGNHEQWRRTVRRDAYVQLLLAASEAERLVLPHDEAATTPEAVRATETALLDMRHRMETAYFVVRLESAELDVEAAALTRAGKAFAAGKEQWAAYRRAHSVLERMRGEPHDVHTEIREAVNRLRQVSRAAHTDPEADEFGALLDAQQALSLVPELNDSHIDAIILTSRSPVNLHRLEQEFTEARRKFLEAAHADLDDPSGVLAPGGHLLWSLEGGRPSPSTPAGRRSRSVRPSPGAAE